MSRILLAVSRYDYGKPEWGDSFEYVNLLGPLQKLGHEVLLFDTLDPARRHRPAVAERDLHATIDEFDPDLMLCLLSTDELPLDAIRKAASRTVTVNWFADDEWRFDWYGRRVAPAFDWVVTTSRRAEANYQRIAGVRPLFLPWGFNPEVFQPRDGPKRFDVSFVGQRHGRRGQTIARLRAEGIDVYTRGGGWPDGRAGWSEMNEIFSATRVNLSLTESSAGPLLRHGWRFRGATRLDGLLIPLFPPPNQMKARIFEVAGSGAFAVSGPFNEVSELFEVGTEVVMAATFKALLDAVVYHLEHEEERERIARAAFDRCMSAHTYRHRFLELFNRIQLTSKP